MKKATAGDLKGEGFREALPGMWLRDEEDFRSRLREVDLVASDLDECMTPLITQAIVAGYVVRRALVSPRVERRLRLLIQMHLHGSRFVGFKAIHLITKRPDNALLIREFEKFSRGVPVQWFRDETKRLVRSIKPGVMDVLGAFQARGVPVGVISLGFEPVLEAIRDGLAERHGHTLDFIDCSPVEVDAEGRFVRFAPGEIRLEPMDKAVMLEERLENYGASLPLAIGHDQDDLEMLRAAGARGGLRVGIGPLDILLDGLDAVVLGTSWEPFAKYICDCGFRNADWGIEKIVDF